MQVGKVQVACVVISHQIMNIKQFEKVSSL